MAYTSRSEFSSLLCEFGTLDEDGFVCGEGRPRIAAPDYDFDDGTLHETICAMSFLSPQT